MDPNLGFIFERFSKETHHLFLNFLWCWENVFITKIN